MAVLLASLSALTTPAPGVQGEGTSSGTAAANPSATNNDLIGNAIPITASPYILDFDTRNFNQIPDDNDPEVECGGQTQGKERQSRTAWFKLTPASAGEFVASTEGSSSVVDTVLALWTNVAGAPGSLVACNDDNCLPSPPPDGGQRYSRIPCKVEETAPALVAGQSYFVEVMSYQVTHGGLLRLSVTYSGLLAPNPRPQIQSLTPSGGPLSNSAFALTVNGSAFASGATVSFGGTVLTPASIAPNLVTVTVAAGLVTTAGVRTVTISNPAPGGGPSNALPFLVYPSPALQSVAPLMLTRGTGPLLLGITGTGFAGGVTTATFAGESRALLVDTSASATLTLLPSDLAVLGNRPLIATNAFGGGVAVASAPLQVFVRSRADANCNGSVDSGDALFIQRIVAGLAVPVANCDANADAFGAENQPDIGDALYLRRVVAGIVTMP